MLRSSTSLNGAEALILHLKQKNTAKIYFLKKRDFKVFEKNRLQEKHLKFNFNLNQYNKTVLKCCQKLFDYNE